MADLNGESVPLTERRRIAIGLDYDDGTLTVWTDELGDVEPGAGMFITDAPARLVDALERARRIVEATKDEIVRAVDFDVPAGRLPLCDAWDAQYPDEDCWNCGHPPAAHPEDTA